MKSRPRSVERDVAKCIQDIQRVWYPNAVITRIPVLGRTGPDIWPGPMGLAIDVKSRLSMSKRIMAQGYYTLFMEDGNQDVYIGCRLENLVELLREQRLYIKVVPANKALLDWWKHMDEWSQANGRLTSAVVTHIPGTWIKNATIWFLETQFDILRNKLEMLNDAKNDG